MILAIILPALLQQTSERLKLEAPSPPSPPVQVTVASAARQQGCLPSSATFPSRRLGQPGTSPTTAAQIRGRKTTHPATIPQRHCPSVKRRDSTEAGPPGAPPPPSPHRLSMGAPHGRSWCTEISLFGRFACCHRPFAQDPAHFGGDPVRGVVHVVVCASVIARRSTVTRVSGRQTATATARSTQHKPHP